MADVQVENGFTRTANELVDEIGRRRFTERELTIIRYIERHAYGYGQKDCAYSARSIADWSGIDPNNLRRAVKSLKDAQVITVEDDRIAIQKDHDRWLVLPRARVELTRRTGRINPLNGSNQPVDNLENGSNQPVKRVELTRHDDGSNQPERVELTRQNGSNQAGHSTKEKRKIDQTDQIVAPASQTTFLTDEMLADLKVAINGIPIGTVTPHSLPGRLRAVLAGKLSSAPDEVARVFDQMPLAVQVAWYCKAIAKAKAAGAQHGGIMRYAATVIANTLIEGGDMLWDEPPRRATPSGPAPVPVSKPAPKGKYADRPWWIPPYEGLFGSYPDDLAVEFAARRAKDLSGAAIDTKTTRAMFEAEGLDATMNYIEAARQAARQARTG